MDKLKIILVSLMTISFFSGFGQDLAEYRWENRLLLIVADEHALPKVQDQLRQYQSVKSGLQERKLIIYTILPKRYQIANNDKGEWIMSKEYFHRYKPSNKTFEITLIGLDGGIKLRQTNLLSPEKLFAIIDGMPMRRAEIRKNKTKY